MRGAILSVERACPRYEQRDFSGRPRHRYRGQARSYRELFATFESVAVFTQVRGVDRHFQLKLDVRRQVELSARRKGFVLVAFREFDVQSAGDDVHDFALAGPECVSARGHHADGGFTFRLFESNRFDGAVEVLVDFEHERFLGKGLKKVAQYAERIKGRHPL